MRFYFEPLVYDSFHYFHNLNNELIIQEGPLSLTCGKGQGSHCSHLQRTTNVVHQILVEGLSFNVKLCPPGRGQF